MAQSQILSCDLQRRRPGRSCGRRCRQHVARCKGLALNGQEGRLFLLLVMLLYPFCRGWVFWLNLNRRWNKIWYLATSDTNDGRLGLEELVGVSLLAKLRGDVSGRMDGAGCDAWDVVQRSQRQSARRAADDRGRVRVLADGLGNTLGNLCPSNMSS